jgi:hypothetical protein
MGMFSEIYAEGTAKDLEKILLDIIIDGKDFVYTKNRLYEMYLNECGEAWSAANPIIKACFTDNNSSTAETTGTNNDKLPYTQDE